jgi:hypothetical protein
MKGWALNNQSEMKRMKELLLNNIQQIDGEAERRSLT